MLPSRVNPEDGAGCHARRTALGRAIVPVVCVLAALPAVAHAVPLLQAPSFENEVQYLEFTIDHHYSALRMTELAAGTSAVGSTSTFAGSPDVFAASPAKATDPVALSVATMANATQRREIIEGQDFLKTYYGITFIPTLEPSLQPLVTYGAFPSAGSGGTAVPEPASAAVLAAGLLGLGLALRGRRPARAA